MTVSRSAHLDALAMTLAILSAAPLAARAAQTEHASPAAAPSTPIDPVTVQGVAKPKVIQEQARSFVEAHAAPIAKINQIGRWHEPICVQVVNLTPEQAAQVQARVETVARGVGLKVMKPGCRSNIQIVLTSQPQALIDKVARRDEHFLGFHWRAELSRVKAVTHPIQAWYMTATQGSGGTGGTAFAFIGSPASSRGADDPQLHAINTGSLLGETNKMETLDIPENGSPAGCADNPHFSACLRSVFKNVLVVVDSHAVEGKDLGAVADYLAMVALSRANSLDGCSALPSVMDLLAKSPCAGRDAPDGLTAADASFLTSLYASDPEAKMSSEQGDIAGRMAKILIKANR